MPTERWVNLMLASLLSAATVACSANNAIDEDTAEQRADELVGKTQRVGIYPRLTPEVVESLYGTDASGVCDAFDGGLSTAASNLVLGHPGHGRRKAITAETIVYTGLVVETYCPELIADFKDAIRDVDPLEVNR